MFCMEFITRFLCKYFRLIQSLKRITQNLVWNSFIQFTKWNFREWYKIIITVDLWTTGCCSRHFDRWKLCIEESLSSQAKLWSPLVVALYECELIFENLWWVKFSLSQIIIFYLKRREKLRQRRNQLHLNEHICMHRRLFLECLK